MHSRCRRVKKITAGGRAVLGLVLLLAVAVLGGCASVAPAERPAVELFWPSAPFEPRIQWLKEIHSRQDAGISKGFWKRIVEFVVGEEVEGISKPYGVFADSQGRIFVADAGRAVIHQFDLKEKEYSLIGQGAPRVFQAPIAITGDETGNLYITDSVAGTVFSYNLSDKKLTPFIAGKLARPTGIAFLAKKRLLYISDTVGHQVVVFDLQGRERFRIGSRGEAPGFFNYPTDLFLDSAGDLYVTDALNARIQVFTADGKFLRTFGTAGDSAGYFAKPKGVAVDSQGNIYVSDAIQDSVQIYDRKGVLMLDFGEIGNGPGQFWMPSGIYIDATDTVYVADSYNQRIQIFKYLKSTEGNAAPPAPK
jgi:DNA-binding beta-propeller fold protein YncE